MPGRNDENNWGVCCGPWPYTLIHSYLSTVIMWDLCHVSCMFMHTHTHTFISPVACSLSSCCVVLWFEVIYIHSCVVCDCRYLCLFLFVCFLLFSQLVCLQVLLVVLRLDSPKRPWIVFCFVFTGVAAVCLVFHCLSLSISVPFLFLYSSSFPAPQSGSALFHIKYCNNNK